MLIVSVHGQYSLYFFGFLLSFLSCILTVLSMRRSFRRYLAWSAFFAICVLVISVFLLFLHKILFVRAFLCFSIFNAKFFPLDIKLLEVKDLI